MLVNVVDLLVNLLVDLLMNVVAHDVLTVVLVDGRPCRAGLRCLLVRSCPVARARCGAAVMCAKRQRHAVGHA